jgi:uncharacterized Zn finger protein
MKCSHVKLIDVEVVKDGVEYKETRCSECGKVRRREVGIVEKIEKKKSVK